MKVWLKALADKISAGDDVGGERIPESLSKKLDKARDFDDSSELLALAIETATEIARLIINDPIKHQSKVTLLTGLMGRHVNANECVDGGVEGFSVFGFGQAEVDIIKNMIKKLTYEHYPFVVLARYLPVEFRLEMLDAVIEYADHPHESMDWASSGEACETLGFLNQKPEESIQCLGRHLNDGGCDEMPEDNIMCVLPVFRSYTGLIEDELHHFVRQNLLENEGITPYAKHLSQLKFSPQLAQKWLDIIDQQLIGGGLVNYAIDAQTYGEDSEGCFMSFYGQLCLIAKQALL